LTHLHNSFDFGFNLCFEEELKKLPAPEVAVKYYTEGDLYMFGKSASTTPPESAVGPEKFIIDDRIQG
jgi:hypothetical protein